MSLLGRSDRRFRRLRTDVPSARRPYCVEADVLVEWAIVQVAKASAVCWTPLAYSLRQSR